MSDLIIVDGNCDCKKTIFAVHEKVYVTYGIPPSFTPYWAGQLLEGFYGDPSRNATNTYMHCLFFIEDGTGSTPIGTNLATYTYDTLIDAPGVLLTDIATIQAMFDFYYPGEAYYTITNDNQPVVFLSPAMVARLADPDFFHPYIGSVDTPSTYDQKLDINTAAPYTLNDVALGNDGLTPACTPIQQIKEIDSCTNIATTRYITEDFSTQNPDGSYNLIDASVAIPAFDPLNIQSECPKVSILKTEACGKIDASADCFEIFRIDSILDTLSIIKTVYTNKFGAIIAGDVEEVCCTCDCLCGPSAFIYTNRCHSYGGSFNGDSQFPNDKHNLGADIFIRYLEVDGTVIINTQTLIGSTTPGPTFRDDGYGLAYNKIVDILNNSTFIQNANLKFLTSALNRPDTGFAVEYNNTKDVRLVLSDFVPSSSAATSWSFKFNGTQAWDALGDATTISIPFDETSVDNELGNRFNMLNCEAI